MYFKITIAGLIWIFLYKLFPYNIPPNNSFSIESIIHEFSQDRLAQLKDYVELLISLSTFSLLGFGLAGLLKNQRLGGAVNFFIVLLTSISLGTASEVLQALSAVRNPNLLDILTDTLGGVIGWFCFSRGRFQVFRYASALQLHGRNFLRSHLSLPTLATGFIGYFLIATLGMLSLPTSTNLSNWDSSFPLLIGNELTGDRPWQGSIEAVQIFDRALSEAEITHLLSRGQKPLAEQDALLASYQFTNKDKEYPDQTGQLPELSWTNTPSGNAKGSGVSLSAAHWLKTPTSATYLNERIKKSAQLTLDVIVQPDSLKQRGPARILSISKDSLHRNLTLGQEGKNLVFRLRTPVTGHNGSNPEIIVPQVFTDSSPHHLVMTYLDSALRVYIDRIDTLYTFKIANLGYKVLYYGAIFIPLGSLLSLFLEATQGRLTARIALGIGGIVLPALLLEGLLASTDHRSFSLENLTMSLAFIIGTLLILKGQVKSLMKAA